MRSILDLGCGNGELARTLSRRGHHGSYLGLDFSLPLLDEAEREAFAFPVQFMQADLVSSDWDIVAGDGRVAAKQRIETKRSGDKFDIVFLLLFFIIFQALNCVCKSSKRFMNT